MVHFQYNTPCWREKQTKQLKVEGTVVPVVRVFAGWRRPQFNMQHSQDSSSGSVQYSGNALGRTQ